MTYNVFGGTLNLVQPTNVAENTERWPAVQRHGDKTHANWLIDWAMFNVPPNTL